MGFATFDNQIQFYSLKPGQSQPQMLVVPDADEPYCPLPQSVVSSLSDCRSLAEGLLDQIPRIYAGTNHLDGCATAAIEACILALKVADLRPQFTEERSMGKVRVDSILQIAAPEGSSRASD